MTAPYESVTPDGKGECSHAFMLDDEPGITCLTRDARTTASEGVCGPCLPAYVAHHSAEPVPTHDTADSDEKPWFRDELAKSRAFNESLPPHARLVVSSPVTSKESTMTDPTKNARPQNVCPIDGTGSHIAAVFDNVHSRLATQRFNDDDGNDIGTMSGGHAAVAIALTLQAALALGWTPPTPICDCGVSVDEHGSEMDDCPGDTPDGAR